MLSNGQAKYSNKCPSLANTISCLHTNYCVFLQLSSFRHASLLQLGHELFISVSPKMSFYSFAFICSWCLNFLLLFKVSSRTCLANMHRRIYFLVCVLLILQDCIVRSRSFLSLSSQIRNFFLLDEYVHHQWNNKE